MTNEEFYDQEIAPKLLELCDKCKERDMSFLALVEFEPEHRGRTERMSSKISIGQRLAHWAARADGNLDAVVFAAKRYAKEHGHNSVVLTLLEKS